MDIVWISARFSYLLIMSQMQQCYTFRLKGASEKSTTVTVLRYNKCRTHHHWGVDICHNPIVGGVLLLHEGRRNLLARTSWRWKYYFCTNICLVFHNPYHTEIPLYKWERKITITLACKNSATYHIGLYTSGFWHDRSATTEVATAIMGRRPQVTTTSIFIYLLITII